VVDHAREFLESLPRELEPGVELRAARVHEVEGRIRYHILVWN
jgi:hypothetical protein